MTEHETKGASMQDINVQTTLPALSFDFDGLMAWAKSITEQYEGLVVQEEDVQAIKSEMAGLNKLKAKLEAARKETVKQVSAPIRQFEDQIKEVVGVFTETYQSLSEQVKAYEEKAREEKRQHVQFQIDSVLDEHGLTDKLTIEIDPSWLNKSKTLKAVRAEVESRVLQHIREERERAELEQAKADRAVAIEVRVRDNARLHGFDLPVSRFYNLNDLQIPLAEVLEQIDRCYADRAAKNAQAQAAPVVEAVQRVVAHEPVEDENPELPDAPKEADEGRNTITVQITYTDASAEDVEAALRSIQMVATLNIIPQQRAA